MVAVSGQKRGWYADKYQSAYIVNINAERNFFKRGYWLPIYFAYA
jgi:hypothetical protein